jgi:hypothetical protein
VYPLLGTLGAVAAKDPEARFRAADRRLRALLFGDGMYHPGIAKGDENRTQAARELRVMREAFEAAVARAAAERVEEAEARIADLEQELRRLAAASAARTTRRRKAS